MRDHRSSLCFGFGIWDWDWDTRNVEDRERTLGVRVAQSSDRVVIVVF